MKSGPQKYVCDLTLDRNTLCKKLSLSENDRKITWGEKQQPYDSHQERFDYWAQVLCTEGLTGRCYWEVEWSEVGAHIAVTYKGINRFGSGKDCRLGYNDKSWILEFYKDSSAVYHNSNKAKIPVNPSNCHRVGVYLDWPAGILSFYRVSSDTLTHLYTFNTTFTEPLYPGFNLWPKSIVSLCQLV
ncbi:hypothetical protein UPYG_G00244470 [Umbra pygmaea]|uniref:B30.2/SPRY domain-containing protein n=1 Tax=Umbra pygmaea TaxID=75934 RepID=A0ABD0WYA9_UMBPY